jgi:hypothetical protein
MLRSGHGVLTSIEVHVAADVTASSLLLLLLLLLYGIALRTTLTCEQSHLTI